jgi:hypothetical protein
LALILGLASALPFLITLTTPSGAFFTLLVPLPLFLSGLSLGFGAVTVSAATTSLVLGLQVALAVFQATENLGLALLNGAQMVLATAVMLTAPVVILVRQALLTRTAGDGGVEWYPPGLLVTWLAGFGVVHLAVIAATVALLDGGTSIEGTFSDMFAAWLAAVLPDLPSEEVAELSQFVAYFGLGLGATGWLLLLAINGVLAQGALGRAGRNLRPAPDIAALELPRWLAVALAVSGAIALLASGDLAFLARGLALVLLLPYIFAGLAVVHTAFRRHKARILLMVIFYVILVFFTWPMVFVIALGLVDQWFGFRRRLLAADAEREDE